MFDHEACKEESAKNFRKTFEESRKLFIPICKSDHWTLVVVIRAAKEGEKHQIRYYDSLSKPSEPCREYATLLIKGILGEEYEVPSRWNKWTQAPSTGVCGVAILHWTEEELRDSRGEGLGNTYMQTSNMSSRNS